jgi:hypothetical protein
VRPAPDRQPTATSGFGCLELLPLQRRQLPDGGSVCCRHAPRTSTKLRIPFRGSCVDSIGLYWIRATPRSTFAVSGRVLRVFSADVGPTFLGVGPLLSADYLPPRSQHTIRQPHPRALFTGAPLLEFGPLQRATIPGARMSRSFQPPAPSVLTVSHRLDGFLHPKPCRACFIPTALLGFPRATLRRSTRPFDPDRATAPAFPLQGLPSLRTNTCSRALLSRAWPALLRGSF